MKVKVQNSFQGKPTKWYFLRNASSPFWKETVGNSFAKVESENAKLDRERSIEPNKVDNGNDDWAKIRLKDGDLSK